METSDGLCDTRAEMRKWISLRTNRNCDQENSPFHGNNFVLRHKRENGIMRTDGFFRAFTNGRWDMRNQSLARGYRSDGAVLSLERNLLFLSFRE
jgi:hypothetical protein